MCHDAAVKVVLFPPVICFPMGVVVTKNDYSKLRLILGMRFPNEFMHDIPFKMESIRMMCDLVRSGDVMLGVDWHMATNMSSYTDTTRKRIAVLSGKDVITSAAIFHLVSSSPLRP